MRNIKSLVYLATPYRDKEYDVERYRYCTSLEVQSALLDAGIPCFNPLAHTVEMVEQYPPQYSEYSDWLLLDLNILKRCDELLVLALPGWEESSGVKQEMFAAMKQEMPITVIHDGDDISHLPKIREGQQFYGRTVVFEIDD